MFSAILADQLFESIKCLVSKGKADCGSFSFGKYLVEVVDRQKYPILDEILDFCTTERCVVVSLAPEATVYIPFKNESDHDTSVPDMDVTGCPLETSYNNEALFDTTWIENPGKANQSLNSERIPLHKDEISFVFDSLRELCLRKVSSDQLIELPIVILCDGRDTGKTIVKGLWFTKDSFKRFLINCNTDKLLTANDIPKLDRFKEEHGLTVRGRKVQVSGSATFEVLECSSHPSDDFDEETQIHLSVRWNDDVQRTLVDLGGVGSTCVLNAKVCLGDERSPAKLLCKELMILQEFVKCLELNNSWPSPDSRDNSTCATRTMEDKVACVLEQIKVKLAKKVDADEIAKRRPPSDTDSKGLFEFAQFSARPRQDLIDILWNNLKDCESLEELLACMTSVLESIASGTLKPTIFPYNRATQMGEIVMDILRKKTKAPPTVDSQTLPILVEMGIQKLEQDYLDLFLASNLVSKESLLPFIGRNDCMTPSDSFKSLMKLHFAAETVAMCSRISSSQDFLSRCARVAVKQVALHDCTESRLNFVIPVERSMVEHLFSRFSPAVWNVRLNSEAGSYKVQNSFHLTAGHPLDSGYRRICGDSKETCYLLSMATAVSDIIF